MSSNLNSYFKELSGINKKYRDVVRKQMEQIRNSSSPTEKHLMILFNAIIDEIEFLHDDISNRTEMLAEQQDRLNKTADFLEKYSHVLGEAVVAIRNKTEQIQPIQELLEQIKKEQNDLQEMKNSFNTRVKQKAEQNKKEREEQQEKIKK